MKGIFLPEGYICDTPENTGLISSFQGLEYAYKNNVTLEARATVCDADHNLYVNLGSFRGIIPKQEACYSPDGIVQKDIAIITKVGKPVCFKILSLPENEGNDVILSRKQAQSECWNERIKNLVPGDVTDAKVTHLEPFGAFCDIGGGIVSLLSVDCISVSRISHPSQRLYPGQKIKCIIKSNDAETSRVQLTTKELFGTWAQNAARFKAGQTVSGIVRSVEPYGIFVELAPNLAGLAEWCPTVAVGQGAAVYIKSIIPEKMKIKLVIVDSYEREAEVQKNEYFFDGVHMDRWDYSPPECSKCIFTEFI